MYSCTRGKEAPWEGFATGKARPSEALLSVGEVAEYFGVTTTTVYRWCKEGRIPCLKIGKHWRVRREELVDLLKESEESRGA